MIREIQIDSIPAAGDYACVPQRLSADRQARPGAVEECAIV